MARGKRYQPEQVVNLLRQIEVAVANGNLTRIISGVSSESDHGLEVQSEVPLSAVESRGPLLIRATTVTPSRMETGGWRSNLDQVELPERDANRCILVRGCKPVFVLLCDAEELLHLIRSWRCGRPVRIEWPCELAEEAVEFLLAHGN